MSKFSLTRLMKECEFCFRKRPLTRNLCRECNRQFEIANADIFTPKMPMYDADDVLAEATAHIILNELHE